MVTGEHSEDVKKMKERLASYRSLHLEVKNELEIVNGLAKTFTSLLTNTTMKVNRLRDEHKNIIETVNWLKMNAESELVDFEPHLIDLIDNPLVKQLEKIPVISKDKNPERKTFADILRGGQSVQNDSSEDEVPGGQSLENGFEPEKVVPVQNPDVLKTSSPRKSDSRSNKTKSNERLAETYPSKSKRTKQKPLPPKIIPFEPKNNVKPIVPEVFRSEPVASDIQNELNEQRTLLEPVTQKNAEKRTKRQLKLMKEQEEKEKRELRRAKKNETKKMNRLAEEARLKKEAEKRESFELFVKHFTKMEGARKYEPIPNFDETAAKKFLDNRIHYHQRTNDPDLAMYCETLLDHICPIIVHAVFEFKTPGISFPESLKIEKRLFVNIQTLGAIYETCCCFNNGSEEQAKDYIKKFISNYTSVQEQIRKNGAEIPETLKSKDVLKSIISRSKSENLKEMTWETSKTFFEQVTFGGFNYVKQKFDSMLLSEIAKTNHSVFITDGHILQKLVLEGTPKAALIEEYIGVVTRLQTL